MQNTARITKLQADNLNLQEQARLGEISPSMCKGAIKMLDYKIRKLTQTATRRGG